MKRNLKITGIILAGLLLAGCGKTEEEHLTEKLEVEVSTQYDFDMYDLEGTVFTSLEETNDLCTEYLYEIGQVIEEPYWWEEINPTATKLYLDLSFGSTGKSLTEVLATKCGEDGLNGGIHLGTVKSSYFSTDGDISHEMTHMIGYMHNFSSSLDEGFCE